MPGDRPGAAIFTVARAGSSLLYFPCPIDGRLALQEQIPGKHMFRTLSRSIPSLFVVALVVLVARAQPTRPLPWSPAAVPATEAPAIGRAVSAQDGGARMLEGPDPVPCSTTATSAASATAAFCSHLPYLDVIQPTGQIVSMESASGYVSVLSPLPVTYTVGWYDEGAEDPLVAPIPLFRSSLPDVPGEGWVDIEFPRPLVLEPLPGVFQGATYTMALRMSAEGGSGEAPCVGYDPDATSPLPSARYHDGVAYVPLPGPHPVLAHQICDVDPGLRSLRVLQQVLNAADVTMPGTYDLVQTFQVPVTVTADWVELAIETPGAQAPVEVQIFDPGLALQPDAGPLPVTFTAGMLDPTVTIAPPMWAPTLPLAEPARLVPGKDYWLTVRTQGHWALGVDPALDGIGYEEGKLYTRFDDVGPFVEDQGRDLAFRLIGTPDVSDPGPPPECAGGIIVRSATSTASIELEDLMSLNQTVTLTAVPIGALSIVGYGGAASTTMMLRVPAGPGQPPDPDLIPLRGGHATTTPEFSWRTAAYDPPLVVRAVTGTADWTDRDLAIELVGPAPGEPRAQIGYDPLSGATLTPALLRVGEGPWEPLPGTNPVLAHSLCGAGDYASSTNQLFSVQQVIRRGSPTTTADLLQSFRVPVACELDWSELALLEKEQGSGVEPVVALIAPFDPSPSVTLGDGGLEVAVMTLGLPGGVTHTSSFQPTTRLSARPVLTPGVDYWLRLDSGGAFEVSTASATAAVGGALYGRDDPTGPYAAADDRTLAFRLIGAPVEIAPNEPTHVTRSLSFAGGATSTAAVQSGDLRRSAIQPLRATSTPSLEHVHVPLIADGAPTTLTLILRGRVGDQPAPPGEAYIPFATVTLTAETGAGAWQDGTFDRPIIVGAVTGTAEAGDVDLVIREEVRQAGRSKVAYVPSGPVTLTAAYVETGGGIEPLPGDHPVLGHVVTSTRTAELDGPWVIQQAFTYGGPITRASTTIQLLQVFRVPTEARADWVEIAIPGGQSQAPPMEVGLFDPEGGALLPGPIQVTHTASIEWLSEMEARSSFHDAHPFHDAPVLVPGRDYWLVLQTFGAWTTGLGHATTTPEGLGGLYTRPDTQGEWTELPGEHLLFRLIGTPTGAVGVTRPVARAEFAVRTEPNPFSSELSFAWSGGTGRVRIEIFDLAGRRVRDVRDAGPAIEGTWVWRGDDDGGRSLRAGAYFARVTPAGGRTIQRRVVLVR